MGLKEISTLKLEGIFHHIYIAVLVSYASIPYPSNQFRYVLGDADVIITIPSCYHGDPAAQLYRVHFCIAQSVDVTAWNLCGDVSAHDEK